MGEISYFLKELPKKLKEVNSIRDLKIDVYKTFNVEKMKELSEKIKEEEIPYLKKLEKSLILIDRFKRRYGDKISGDFRLIIDVVDNISNIFERKYRFGKAKIIKIAELQSKALVKYKWDSYKKLLHEENDITGEFRDLLNQIETKEIEMIRKSKSVYLNNLFDWVMHPTASVFSKLAAACCLTLALAGATLGQTSLDVDVGQLLGIKGRELTASIAPTKELQRLDFTTNIPFKSLYLDIQKTRNDNLSPFLVESFASKLTYWRNFDRLFIKGLSLKTRAALAYYNLPNLYHYLKSEKINSNHVLMYGYRLGLDFRKLFGKNEILLASDYNVRIGEQIFPKLNQNDLKYSMVAFSDVGVKLKLQLKRHLNPRLMIKFNSIWEIYSYLAYAEFNPKLKPELNMELLNKFNNWYFGVYSNYDLGTKKVPERNLMGLGVKLNGISKKIGIDVGAKIDIRKPGLWAIEEFRTEVSFRFGGVRYEQRLINSKDYKKAPIFLGEDYSLKNDEKENIKTMSFDEIIKIAKTPRDIARISSLVDYGRGGLDLYTDSHTPLETWEKKAGICKDFAKFQVFLLNKAGYEAYFYGFCSPSESHAITVYKDKEDGKFRIIEQNGIKYVEGETKEEAVIKYLGRRAFKSFFRDANGDIVQEEISPTLREIEDFWNRHMAF